MHLMIKFIAVAAALGMCPGILKADEPKSASVKDLYDWCLSDNSNDREYCRGYISGAGSTFFALGSGLIENGLQPHFLGICPTNEFTTDTSVQAFLIWTKQHPEAWQEIALTGVMNALQGSWPCNE